FDSIRNVILWGLCDATTAICERARHDPRIDGIVLLNPWVRTDAGHARAQLRHYYLPRLAQGEFFRKILCGGLNPLTSARDLFGDIGRALGALKGNVAERASSNFDGSLVDRMGNNLRHYHGLVLLIISGRDLTAKEFDAAVRRSTVWRRVLKNDRLTQRQLAEA